MSDIDWSNPKQMISKYFSVREALWLPKWSRLAAPGDGFNDGVASAILTFARLDMDRVREFIGVPIRVHCWYRPARYNQEIGGAPHSSHRCEFGYSACDWDAIIDSNLDIGSNCDLLRSKLMGILEDFGLRMEDNGPKSPWIHLDNAPVKTKRFFNP